jgi:hypothetical protein
MKINLNGSQGNAFFLLGLASKLARARGLTDSENKAIQAEMMSGDYEYLCEVFEREFGNEVELQK